MDEIYELEIDYSSPKCGDNYKTINISLEDYMNSYSDELSHLQQQYDEDSIDEYLFPIKKEFLMECFDFAPGERLESDIQDLIDELDNAVEEYADEHAQDFYDEEEGYDDYDDLDDEGLHEYHGFDE